jgi:hypothetical protein
MNVEAPSGEIANRTEEAVDTFLRAFRARRQYGRATTTGSSV